jgi:rifampin ADP-ribosylating transferase
MAGGRALLLRLQTVNDKAIPGPFYHGTKADLKPGDLIVPGHRSNYGDSKRTSPWVYMSATLSPWGAELAQGDGPGRIYIVEPTGPFVDDPDLTDKKFAGNPTRSYRSRYPLRVVGEVTGWQPHSPAEIKRMTEGRDRMFAAQANRIAHIPSEDDFARLHVRADELAGAWAADAEYLGCTLLMLVRKAGVEVFSAMTFRSEARHVTRTIELPRRVEAKGAWQEGEFSQSGRITAVTAWHDGWVAVIESCITEIGLSLETRLWIAVDADYDRLTFRVDADGPERSWQRNLQLVRGVLTDIEHGEIWDFGTDQAE